jgi:hypothetical protein
VVREQFNGSVQQETGGFNDHCHIAGFYPHLGPWSARLPEDHRLLTRTTMPINDPELPSGFEDCRDGSPQAQLIQDAVEGVCEENVIDRLRHDRSESHGVRQDKMAVGRSGRSNERLRAIQHGRVDVDGVDDIRDGGERGSVNSPSPQHRSTTTIPGCTPISTRTFAASGHNACHHSASGIVVAGKKTAIMQFSCKDSSSHGSTAAPPGEFRRMIIFIRGLKDKLRSTASHDPAR